MKATHKAHFTQFTLLVLKALNVISVTFFFAAAWFTVYANSIVTPFYGKGNYVVIIIFSILFAGFSKLYGGFSIGGLRVSELIYSNVIGIVVSNGLLYGIIVLLTRRLVNPVGLIWAILCQILWSGIWAVYSKRIFFKFNPAKKCFIIYGNEASRDSVSNLDVYRFNVKAVLNIASEEDVEYLKSNILNTECVFLCGLPSQSRNEIVKYCIANGITAYLRPHISDLIISGAKRLQMCNVPVLQCTKSAPSAWYLLCKRGFDIIVSLTALILLSPIIGSTALIIKLYDKGPVFYKQTRLTKNGRKFNVLKFRSMRVNAESDGKARLASVNDDRITPVGKIIRSIRFDELPQLLNILKGDMTIVGPRPERPEIAEDYINDIPEFELRLQVKAGLTGYAQVYGKYNTTPYDKLQMDLMYVANMGIIEDLKIMFATVKILFMPESTEGIEQGKETAKVG